MMTVLLLVSSALADPWWGIGPSLGTMGFPVDYPAVMPELAQSSKGKNLVDPVQFDLRVGAHGVYYLGKSGRMGARLYYGGNFAAWNSQEMTVEWDWILMRHENFQVFGGAGLGFGHDHFGSVEGTEKKDPYLDVTYFPLRGQIGMLWRDRTRAYEANLFGTWHIAGEQTFSATGKAEDEENGTAVSDPFGTDTTKSDAALYVAVGAEITVYFGNFRNKGGADDKDDNKRGKKKKKND